MSTYPTTAALSEAVNLLKSRANELPQQDRPFAYSLIGAWEGGRMTVKQAKWAHTMADRIINPVEPTKPIEIGDVSGLVALFDKASANGLKWPKLRIGLAEGPIFRLHLAGEKSKYLGQLMVTTKPQDGENLYCGRVDLSGVFHPSQKITTTMLGHVKPALVAMATDPAAAGKAYGQRTGHCAFCSLPLDDNRSIEAGYGPVCAENFGLAWGHSKRRKAKGRK
jgi:hypothetical protein